MTTKPKRRKNSIVLNQALKYFESHDVATAKDISCFINSSYKWGVSSHEVSFILSRSSYFQMIDRYASESSGHNLWRLRQ